MKRIVLLLPIFILMASCDATQPVSEPAAVQHAPSLAVDLPSETGVPVTVLGDGQVLDNNERGQAVGWTWNAMDQQVAVLWDGDQAIDLEAPPGLVAWSINERGQIVIGAPRPNPLGLTGAYLWDGGQLTLIGADATARDVNARGQVVGTDWTNGLGFIWDEGEFTYIDPLPGNTETRALALNDVGQVVGVSVRGAGVVRAYLWENGITRPLLAPVAFSTGAIGINRRGHVVGRITFLTGVVHAALWRDGGVIDLGTLGGTHSLANDINDRGQVVGYADTPGDMRRAFLWPDAEGQMMNLGNPVGVEYEGPAQGFAINNRGEVVGGGGNTIRAYVWMP
jgi:probable HAF family extracellular repeat protein